MSVDDRLRILANIVVDILLESKLDEPKDG